MGYAMMAAGPSSTAPPFEQFRAVPDAIPRARRRGADALIRPDQLWPSLGETSLLIGARILPVLALLALAAASGLWWSRHKGTLGGNRKRRIEGTAKAKDIAPVLAAAITDKARSLRPSLKDAQRIAPSDTGILLGNLQGSKTEVRMGWEDVAVAIMAPVPERPPRWRFPPSWPRPAPYSSPATKQLVTPIRPASTPAAR